MNTLRRYLTTYVLLGKNAFQLTFVSRETNFLFLMGKAIRFTMMIIFMLLIQRQVSSVGTYTSSEVVVFYLTYQLIDTIAQILYRGVYSFGPLLRNGNFDLLLAKPINPLFRVLVGEPDLNDVVFLLPQLAVTAWLVSHLPLSITVSSAVLYLPLIVNGLLIATGLHILILSFTLKSSDMDSNLIWLYRDVSRMGQFPVTLYSDVIRLFLFLVIPIGLMITVPAQVLINSTPSVSIGLTTLAGGTFLLVSLRIWSWALKSYSSAGG